MEVIGRINVNIYFLKLLTSELTRHINNENLIDFGFVLAYQISKMNQTKLKQTIKSYSNMGLFQFTKSLDGTTSN